MGEPRKHPRIGALMVLAGAGLALMIHLHPEALRAPAWVAHAAALAFSLAGLALLAQAWNLSRRLQAWLAVVLIGCLLTPMLWIAMASPEGRCRVNILGWSAPAPEWICRSGFAFASVLGLLILALAVRQALRTRRGT